MANKENNCKHLEYKHIDVPKEYLKALEMIFTMQQLLQERLGYKFKDMTLAEVADFLIYDKHCLDDETSEMLDAVGGINDGIGNAAWKKWKKDRKKAINYLTEYTDQWGNKVVKDALKLGDGLWTKYDEKF